MADIIRIKRRASPGSVGAPSTLANAELAYNENDHTLYIGEGTGGGGGSATVIIPIGGNGLGSSALPLINGTAAAGTATTLSRGDHVHPTDTTRAPIASPTFTGTVTTPTLTLSAQAADLAMNSRKIIGLADPAAAQDAATKNYVDNLAQGLDPKASVRAASTANLTLSGTQTVDGIALVALDRVLVKDQAAPATNGIYVVAAGAWTRATDMDAWAEVPSGYTFVEQGTVNADTGWVCTADQGGTIGTTAITWAQFSGGGSIAAGAGLTKTGSTIDVVGTAARILVNADNIDIDSAYAGQASIITLGSVTTGSWNGTTIAVNRGGSGASTLTGYLKGNGTSAFTAGATIPNTDITGLGTMAVQNAASVAITGGTIDGVTFDGGTF